MSVMAAAELSANWQGVCAGDEQPMSCGTRENDTRALNRNQNIRIRFTPSQLFHIADELLLLFCSAYLGKGSGRLPRQPY